MASEWWGRVVFLLEGRNNQKPEGSTQLQVHLASLKACSRTRNLEKGKQVHAEAVKCGHDWNIYVANALINMYAKCGSMVDAHKVFDSMKYLTVVSWNVLILGYVDNGQNHTALDLFITMRTEDPSPSFVTFMAIIKACTSIAVKEGASRSIECRDMGKGIHNMAVENGCNSEVYVQSSLVGMYAKLGSMVEARAVFDGIKNPTVVSWTILILGYADNGQDHIVLDVFTRMRDEGAVPDSVIFVAALRACNSLGAKEGASHCRDLGKGIHNLATENDCNSHVYVQSTLIDVYAKCGSMVNAREVFDGMKHPTVVSWTSLILGYANNGEAHTALNMFSRMKTEGPAPDSVLFVAALKACTSLAIKGASQWTECRDWGKDIVKFAMENGCSKDVCFQSTLIDMYSKCDSMVDAQEVFNSMKYRTVVSWTTLIMGYADNGQGHNALGIFARMRTDGLAPDSVVLVAALKACICLASKEGIDQQAECRNRGKVLHSISVENDCNSDVYMQSTLVDMYAKCRSMVDAREVFDRMHYPDVVCWNVLILGYTGNEQARTALDIFTRMRTEGPVPNSATFGAALNACGLLGALEFGRTIHSELDSVNHLDVALVTCLVDFYSKCGSLVEAQRIFYLHSAKRDMITWNTLLAGFSNCGDTDAVFALFNEMQDAGFRPDGVTFLSILTCCSHAGLVVKGKDWFDGMHTKYGVIPTIKHYTSMIDLFGRENKLDEAMALLKRMPCSPDNVTWRTILGACRKWKNVGLGRLAVQALIDLNDKDAAAYLLMEQMQQEQGMVISHRRTLKTYINPGKTCWTSETGIVHTFSVDSRHPQIDEIRDKWESMCVVMRQHGYAPNLVNVIGGNTEVELCSHSERLALVCALINSHPQKIVRIVKNLRVCDDCHIAIALTSKLECRTIICRDARRIHIFKDGKCSCGDFL